MLTMVYQNDSFHTLDLMQQIGLVCLSVVLLGLTLGGSYYLMKKRSLVVRLAIALVVFYLFLWLSPQIYYAYYQLLWPSLEFRIVVGDLPTLWHLLELITFQGRATTTWHAQGLLGVLLLVLAGWPQYK